MKDYLIDTHALLWFFAKDSKLSEKALSIIQRPENQIYVSFASYWEISIKTSLGKLSLPWDIEKIIDQCEKVGMIQLDLTGKHLKKLSTLPSHHKDPFDRMIISQAIAEQVPILSVDKHFSSYDVEVAWD